MGQALMDAAYGLRRLSSFKKKILYFKDMDPNFTPVVTALAKEGIELIAMDLKCLKSPESIIEQLGKDILFVLYSVDDPILGRLFEIEKFESLLAENSCFRIRISYNQHLYADLPKADRNTLHIWGAPSGLALLGLGERVRVGASGSELRSWSGVHSAEIIDELQARENKKNKVIEFEEGFRTFASLPMENRERVWDRAVLAWPDMDGSAVIDSLGGRMNLALSPPGELGVLESTSLSRWGGLKTFDWLHSWDLSPEIIRGLIVIDADILSADLALKIREVRTSLLEDQNGTQ
jgi:hypothetical protein